MKRRKHQGWRAERWAGQQPIQSVSAEEYDRLNAERLARRAEYDARQLAIRAEAAKVAKAAR